MRSVGISRGALKMAVLAAILLATTFLVVTFIQSQNPNSERRKVYEGILE
nr:hypothetical protein [Candidatus Freyarchaeota archaeon]